MRYTALPGLMRACTVQPKTQSLVRSPFGEELDQQSAPERENNREPYVKCCKLQYSAMGTDKQQHIIIIIIWSHAICPSSVLVNCTIVDTITHAAVHLWEKVNRDSCLPAFSAGEYTALARARLCRAVYSPLHCTGTQAHRHTLITVHFFSICAPCMYL